MTGTIISGDRRLGGDELDARAARAARGLAELGLGPGECLALVLRNDIAFATALILGGVTALPRAPAGERSVLRAAG